MDRATLERELEALHPRSYGWALCCCRWQREEAEEVLQTVYLKMLDGRARFRGESSLKTWLFSVIRRTAQAHQRSRWTSWLKLHALAAEPPAEAPQPGTAAAAAERASRLRAEILALAPRQREVLVLVFYHEMTIEQAAAVMGVSLGSARQHYQRAKQRLRGRLEEGQGT